MSTEERNLAAIERWAELYNTDVERMVRECYAPDCLIDVKNGISFRGHDTFAAYLLDRLGLGMSMAAISPLCAIMANV